MHSCEKGFNLTSSSKELPKSMKTYGSIYSKNVRKSTNQELRDKYLDREIKMGSPLRYTEGRLFKICQAVA